MLPAPCSLEGRPDPAAVRRGTQGLWSPARAAPPLGVHSKPLTQHHLHQGWPRPHGAHTGTPRPHGSGDGDPGGGSLLVAKDPSQKRAQHTDGALGKVTRLLDSGGGGSPSSEPIPLPERRGRFRKGAGEPGTPHGYGDRPCLHAKHRETRAADIRQAHGCSSNWRSGDARCSPALTPLRGRPAQDPCHPGLRGGGCWQGPQARTPTITRGCRGIHGAAGGLRQLYSADLGRCPTQAQS